MIAQTHSDIITLREFIFYFFGLLGLAIFKVLNWLMPKTAKFIWKTIVQKMRDFQTENNKAIIEEQEKMIKSIDDLKKSVESCKNKKHKIEGELLEVSEAIINNDAEKLSILQNYYLEEREKRKKVSDDLERQKKIANF